MKFRPTACCLTRASPGPGSPTCTSSQVSTSGPPVLWMRMALVMLCLLGSRGIEGELQEAASLPPHFGWFIIPARDGRGDSVKKWMAAGLLAVAGAAQGAQVG